MGIFEEANRGTVFPDDIGKMESHLQAKLLKAVGEGKIGRVGSDEEIGIDVRFIAAAQTEGAKNILTDLMRDKFHPARFDPIRDDFDNQPLFSSSSLFI